MINGFFSSVSIHSFFWFIDIHYPQMINRLFYPCSICLICENSWFSMNRLVSRFSLCYQFRNRCLTARQVQLIVNFLGESD